MKKRFYVLAALLLLILPMLFLTSCEEKKCQHTYSAWTVVTQPTCGKAGKQTRTCSKCTKVESKSIDATGQHVFGEWTVEEQPNCGKEGERSHTCSVCEQTKYETMRPEGEHVYVNGACINCQEGEATKGLEYVVYDDATCGVKGIGTATDIDIIIPSTNNGRTVIAIEDEAFEGLTWLRSIEVKKNIQRIGAGAFHGCTSLTNLYFEDTELVSIGNAAFADCTSLSKVYLPKTLISVGNWAFAGCTSLTTFNLDNANATLETIGEGAFYGCTSFAEFKLVASVKTVGARAFENCSNLTKFTVDAYKPATASVKSSALTAIGERAFFGCRNLTNVNFGEGSKLTDIATSAFENCSALASIVLPETVKTISALAFKGCTALNSVTISVATPGEGQPAPECKWELTPAGVTAEAEKLTVEDATHAALCLKTTYLNYNWKRV